MKPRIRDRLAVALAAILALLAPLAFAQGQGYPSKTVRIIVPYAAGGGADLNARLIAQHLSERLKQPFVVENRGGGSNTIGMQAVLQGGADGYTLGLCTPVFVMTPYLLKSQPYDPLKDFTAVALIGHTPLILVVHPSVPASTVREFIDLARSKPGALNFASLGAATTQGLAASMFNAMTGIDAVQVPYKGSAPGVRDLLAGNVQYMFNALPSMIPHVKAGKLRGLGVTSAKRSPLFPDLPPISETVPGYKVTTWYGFVAPAGTPRPVVDLLNKEIDAILRLPDVRKRLQDAGLDPQPLAPDAMEALLRSESTKWGKVIQDANIQPY